jgi:hypothetical protein
MVVAKNEKSSGIATILLHKFYATPAADNSTLTVCQFIPAGLEFPA